MALQHITRSMMSIPPNEFPLFHDVEGVSSMQEYILISSILMILMVITVLTLTNSVILPPIDRLTEYSFIDIGNGVSTRMVDLYVIAPKEGNISTFYDIPDDVAGKEYFVSIELTGSGDQVSIFNDKIRRNISLSGISSTYKAGGQTTGHGMNKITYRSEAFP